MGSMKGKQAKIDAALGRLADMINGGNLLASADPVGFLETIAAELKDLRAENVKLKGTASIKQDRVNNLEKALRDTLRQLERAINGNAMDGDWIAAELHGRECLYSQASSEYSAASVARPLELVVMPGGKTMSYTPEDYAEASALLNALRRDG